MVEPYADTWWGGKILGMAHETLNEARGIYDDLEFIKAGDPSVTWDSMKMDERLTRFGKDWEFISDTVPRVIIAGQEYEKTKGAHKMLSVSDARSHDIKKEFALKKLKEEEEAWSGYISSVTSDNYRYESDKAYERRAGCCTGRRGRPPRISRRRIGRRKRGGW